MELRGGRGLVVATVPLPGGAAAAPAAARQIISAIADLTWDFPPRPARLRGGDDKPRRTLTGVGRRPRVGPVHRRGRCERRQSTGYGTCQYHFDAT